MKQIYDVPVVYMRIHMRTLGTNMNQIYDSSIAYWHMKIEKKERRNLHIWFDFVYVAL